MAEDSIPPARGWILEAMGGSDDVRAEVEHAGDDMARRRTTVYISSTYRDLVDHRLAAIEAVHGLDCHPVAMEHYAASDERPVDVCLKDVRGSDVYVGVFAWRYGHEPEGHEGKSITHLEYEEAVRCQIPRLIFLLHEDAPWPKAHIDNPDAKIVAFRGEQSRDRTFKHFDSVPALKIAITQALAKYAGGGDADSPAGGEADHIHFIPHLCDRSEEVVGLRGALREAMKARPGRPFVVLVHGTADHCLDRFMERLTRVEFNSRLGKVSDETVDLPDSFRGARHLKTFLTDRLVAKFLPCGSADADLPEVAAALAARKTPQAIRAYLRTEHWINGGRPMLEALIDFWAGWPDSPSTPSIIAILGLTYGSRPAPGLFGRFRRDPYRAANEEARAAIRSLGLDDHAKLGGITLEELRGIQLMHVEQWAREHVKNPRSANPEEDIRLLWRELAASGRVDALPMKHLAGPLSQLLGGTPARARMT